MSAIVALVTLALAVSLVATPESAVAAPNEPTDGRAVYQVQNGDTLGHIARRHGVSVPAIVRANGFKTASVRLKVGSRLAIPTGSGETTVRRAAATKTRARVKPATATRELSPRRGRVQSATITRPSATPRVKPAISTTRRSGDRGPRVRRAALRATAAIPANMVLSVPDFTVAPPPPFVWPVEGAVSSAFGRRRLGWHRGLDVMASPGTPIAAAAAGLVVASDWEGRYGRVVKVAHENGFLTVYAHNSANLVDLGDWVSAGQTIATVGRTGRATREHVHFEIRHDGTVYNPLYLLPEPPRIVQVQEVESTDDEEDE